MKRRAVHPRAIAQVVMTVAMLFVTVAVVVGVRRAAPTSPTTVTVIEGLSEAGIPSEVVTCERTLPEAPDNQEDIEEVVPVGRVTSTEVIECPDAFDGHVVVYVGEVVGDVLQRRGGAWTLVNDDAYALETGPVTGTADYRGGNSGLAVWLPDDLHEELTAAGGPGRRGDVIVVRGVVHRADPADGGGLTIRAIRAEVLVPAETIDLPVNVPQALAALGFAVLAVVVTVIERSAARRR